MKLDQRESIAAVVRAAASQNAQVTLIGALASRLLADAEGHPAVHATKDADFAVRLDAWSEFERLKKALATGGFEADSKLGYRLARPPLMIDLIPFGRAIESPPGRITWPKTDFEMNVIGFQEACETAVESEVDDGVRVRHVTVAGFILLKIVSFTDRNSKGSAKYRTDAEDLMGWFSAYASEAENAKALEEVASLKLKVDFKFAGVALLGASVRKISSEWSDSVIGRFLADYSGSHSAFANALALPPRPYERSFSVDCLSAFGAGYRGV